MKFFATAALIATVNAACVADGNNTCDPAELQCVKRVTSAVPVEGSKKSAEKKLRETYEKNLANDSEIALDYAKYLCENQADAEAFVASSGVADKAIGHTFTYTIEAPIEGKGGSGASTMKAAAVAAALGLIAYM
jgi:hypothetical protein